MANIVTTIEVQLCLLFISVVPANTKINPNFPISISILVQWIDPNLHVNFNDMRIVVEEAEDHDSSASADPKGAWEEEELVHSLVPSAAKALVGPSRKQRKECFRNKIIGQTAEWRHSPLTGIPPSGPAGGGPRICCMGGPYKGIDV